jgi:hypothetical protein
LAVVVAVHTTRVALLSETAILGVLAVAVLLIIPGLDQLAVLGLLVKAMPVLWLVLTVMIQEILVVVVVPVRRELSEAELRKSLRGG